MKNFFLIFTVCIIGLSITSHYSRFGKKISLYILLTVVAFLMVMPFYMMFVMSTLTTKEIFSFPPKLFFSNHLINNINAMRNVSNMFQAFLNSCLVSISNVALVLLFCSMGGYAFAVYDFPFKKFLFGILLGTMMIPWTAGIVPWFVMMSKFGWINSYKALIIPSAANAFGIFWMRQYCSKNIPLSLLDAARIDGCSEWTIFFRIGAPVILPAYATLGIMQFVGVWNDFVQPLLILRKMPLHTLPVALSSMITSQNQDYGSLMLASACTVLPLLIAFLLASRYFLSGLTAGAIKE